MYERGQFPIPYQIAIAIAKILQIDKNMLFDDFDRFINAPYNDELHKVRKTYGLTQAVFAEKAGINCSIYSKWESGSQQPSRKMYQQLITIYPEIEI